MTSTAHLCRISLHPVQGFIDHSRKLRDMVTSSRWLSSAMAELRAILKQDRRVSILLPIDKTGLDHKDHPNYLTFRITDVDDGQLSAALDKWAGNLVDRIAGRISGELLELRLRGGVDVPFDPADVKAAVKQTFHTRWVAVPFEGDLTKQILVDLDRATIQRKMTRAYPLIQSAPNRSRCTQCGERDTLLPSSSVVVRDGGHEEQIAPDDFWSEVYRLGGKAVNVRRNERLCATCLAKRIASSSKLPSTWDAAVSAWRNDLSNDAPLAERVGAALGQIKSEAERAGFDTSDVTWTIPDVDGGIFQGYFDDLPPRGKSKPDPAPIYRAYEGLRKHLEEFRPCPDQYALILMDGDRMGQWFSGSEWNDKSGEPLESWLERFGRAIEDVGRRTREVVKKHHGQLIYAGGDDLMAILPPETALLAAIEIRELFVGELKEFESPRLRPTRPTVSAALVFAHPRRPLALAVRHARLCRERAKKPETQNGFGRDAIVCAILLPSQTIYECGGKWDVHKPVVLGALRLLEEGFQTRELLLGAERVLRSRLAAGFCPDLISNMDRCFTRQGDTTTINPAGKDMLRCMIRFYVTRRANPEPKLWDAPTKEQAKIVIREWAEKLADALLDAIPTEHDLDHSENLRNVLRVVSVFARKEIEARHAAV